MSGCDDWGDETNSFFVTSRYVWKAIRRTERPLTETAPCLTSHFGRFDLDRRIGARFGPAMMPRNIPKRGNGNGRKQWILRIAPRDRKTPLATGRDFLRTASGGIWTQRARGCSPLKVSSLRMNRPVLDRGRDVGCPTPPAQIRTGGFPASGSYRGCLTANRTAGNGCRIVTDGSHPTQRRVNGSHVRGRR